MMLMPDASPTPDSPSLDLDLKTILLVRSQGGSRLALHNITESYGCYVFQAIVALSRFVKEDMSLLLLFPME